MLGSVGRAAEAPRTLKPEDFAAIRDVRDPHLSPDGTKVVYTVKTVDLAKDETAVNLWLAAVDGSYNYALTSGAKKQSHPRWSPDGRSLAFLSARADDGDDQVWLLPSDGGEAEQMTSIKGGVDDFAWAPDSTRLALIVRDPDPRAVDPKAEKKTPPPIVIDRFEFKRDKGGYLVDRYAHLRVLTLATRVVVTLTSGRHDDLFPSWSPDGREIAFMSKRGEDPDRTTDWTLLAIAPDANARERVIGVLPEKDEFYDDDQPFAWSPDGKTLAVLVISDPKAIEYASDNLALIPAQGGEWKPLTAALDRNISEPAWAPDGSALYGLVEDDGASVLMRFSPGDGAPTIIVGGRQRVTAFEVGRDGRLAVLSSTPQRPFEVFAGRPTALQPISRQNDAFLAGVRLGAVEETRFRSKDGTEVHGFIVHPAEPAGGRSPTILRPHGGPQSQHAAEFDFEKQIYAAAGYLVLLPNPRGSSGRGTAYGKAIFADWGHLDVEDDLAAVDDAIARGLADPDRLGVAGWSYGAMTANYLIATTDRFKAAISGAGTSNILAGYGTDQYVRDYEAELGTPWRNPDTWMKVSYPFFHADRIHTPTLFLCGEKDFNVPLLNSEQMYQALRSLGVPTQLVIYPGQHHGFNKPSYSIDRYHRNLDWMARYVRRGPDSSSGR
jgi:dipeptidyl aminopeptidase/acylaminoacyl peptidase